MNDWNPESRALFGAAREATTPTDGDRQRVSASLGLALGSTVGAAHLPASATPASTAPPALPVAPTAGPIAPSAALHVGGLAGSSLLKAAGLALLIGGAAAGVLARRSAAVPAPAGAAWSKPSAPAPATEAINGAERAASPDALSATPAVVSTNAAPDSRALLSGHAHAKRTAGEGSGTDAPSSLQQETDLLKAAQRALRGGQPAEAMAILDEHAKRFPSGSLREERKAARVFALAALGRMHQAKAEADTFARDWPNSPLLDRVRAVSGASAASTNN